MRALFAGLFLSASIIAASAQPGPGPTPDPWVVTGSSINPNGLKVITAAATTAQAGFNLPPGTAPTSPVNGDLWMTSAGLFGQVNGSTVGPFVSAATPCTVCALTNNANNFSVSQRINLTGGSLASAQTGTVLQAASANGVATRAELDAYGATGYFSSVVYGGSFASPAALTSGTEIGGFNAWGYNGSAIAGPRAAFRAFANQNWTTGANGTYADVASTPNGSTAESEVIRFENDGGVTIPSTVTGGSKGAGTLNLTTLYLAGIQATTTINSTSCVLGSSCTITATTSLVVGTTPITGGTTGRVEFNNAGFLGEYTITGTAGSVVMSSSPSITTPSIAGETVSATANFTGTFEINGNAMTFPATTATIASLNNTNQTVTGGANTTPPNLGTFSSGTLTANCGLGPIQYLTNGGSFTIAAPGNSGSCDLWVFNNASAGSISLSGFNSLTNSGEIPDTVNGHLFIYHIEQANSQSIAVVKAGQ